MKLIALQDATFYRMHVPRWAFAPTSGAGAAKHGGRANRPGIEALYLAKDIATAVSEYQQVSTLLPPGTLTSYQLTAAPVVDFTQGYSTANSEIIWDSVWEDFYCDWRELWFNQRVEPPSWTIGDRVISAGAKGILFPSRLSQDGTNLVLFTQTLTAPDKLEVFDPELALPQSQASWS